MPGASLSDFGRGSAIHSLQVNIDIWYLDTESGLLFRLFYKLIMYRWEDGIVSLVRRLLEMQRSQKIMQRLEELSRLQPKDEQTLVWILNFKWLCKKLNITLSQEMWSIRQSKNDHDRLNESNSKKSHMNDMDLGELQSLSKHLHQTQIEPIQIWSLSCIDDDEISDRSEQFCDNSQKMAYSL